MPVAAFEISFSTRKEYKKRKLMEKLHLLLLACFMYKYKIPASWSTTTRAFVSLTKFIIDEDFAWMNVVPVAFI